MRWWGKKWRVGGGWGGGGGGGVGLNYLTEDFRKDWLRRKTYQQSQKEHSEKSKNQSC